MLDRVVYCGFKRLESSVKISQEMAALTETARSSGIGLSFPDTTSESLEVTDSLN